MAESRRLGEGRLLSTLTAVARVVPFLWWPMAIFLISSFFREAGSASEGVPHNLVALSCAMVLSTCGLLTFHIDGTGLLALTTGMTRRRIIKRRSPGESQLVRELITWGLFSEDLLASGAYSVILTDERLYIRFPLSLPCLCHLCVSNEDIVHVKVADWKGWEPMASTFWYWARDSKSYGPITVEYLETGEERAVKFLTKQSGSWIDGMRSAGLPVDVQ